MPSGDFIHPLIQTNAIIELGEGTYNLTKTILINKINNVSIIGQGSDKTFLVFPVGYDGIVVKGSNNFNMNDLTITIYGQNSGYANSALVMEDANYSNIYNCIFNCSDRGYGFGIYLAGPNVNAGLDPNSPTYTSDIATNVLNQYKTNKLMSYSKFNNNVINCVSGDDGVSYSLMYKSEFKNNVINGTKLAIYMVKDCTVTNNIINDSIGVGVFISTPCTNLNFYNNEIHRQMYDGIIISEQLEHVDEQI